MKKPSAKAPKIKRRVVWGFNPIARVVKSKKIYNRNKYKKITIMQ